MRFVLVVGIFFTLISVAQAETTPLSFDGVEIDASACESISVNETKSTLRSKAIDRALFEALRNLPQLEKYRNNFDVQTFDDKIYELAEVALESMNIKVNSSQDDKVCVNVRASLVNSDINKVFDDVAENLPNVEEDFSQENDLGIGLPPKPNITIHEDIAYKGNEIKNASENLRIVEVEVPQNNVNLGDVRIFVENTEYFNGKSSANFYLSLQKDLESIKGIKVQSKFDNQEYTIRPKVLKAKVDNINTETSRMQVVVSVSLIDNKTATIFTEHQNRFVLFTSDNDPQKVAFQLISKLFSEVIKKLSLNIKTRYSYDSRGAIITPAL